MVQAELNAKVLANSFKAQPMRVGSPDRLPPRVVHSPVHPISFHSFTEERIALHKSKREVGLDLQSSLYMNEYHSSFFYSKPKAFGIVLSNQIIQ